MTASSPSERLTALQKALQAVRDATKKDARVDPATLLWVLGDLRIAPASGLVEAGELDGLTRFRDDLSATLRALAYEWATDKQGQARTTSASAPTAGYASLV